MKDVDIGDKVYLKSREEIERIEKTITSINWGFVEDYMYKQLTIKKVDLYRGNIELEETASTAWPGYWFEECITDFELEGLFEI